MPGHAGLLADDRIPRAPARRLPVAVALLAAVLAAYAHPEPVGPGPDALATRRR